MNEQRWLPIESNPQVILPKSFMLQDLSKIILYMWTTGTESVQN
jgi:hypothetical protein